jgi:hypothetical protein
VDLIPNPAANLHIVDHGAYIHHQPLYGARWRHTGGRLESAFSLFD